MSNILRVCRWQVLIAALCALVVCTLTICALAVQPALASNAPVVSGTYEVVQDTALGAQTQVRMRIHLVNHGASDLSVQRMTLWDFTHPEKGATRACAVAVRAHASTATTQEFTIQRADYQLWQRGLRPRLVLQLAGPTGTGAKGTTSKTVVRLDRISSQEAK